MIFGRKQKQDFRQIKIYLCMQKVALFMPQPLTLLLWSDVKTASTGTPGLVGARSILISEIEMETHNKNRPTRGRINQWNLLRSVIVPARLASWPLPRPENLARDKAGCAGPCSIALPPTGRRSNIRRAHRSDCFVAALMIGA